MFVFIKPLTFGETNVVERYILMARVAKEFPHAKGKSLAKPLFSKTHGVVALRIRIFSAQASSTCSPSKIRTTVSFFIRITTPACATSRLQPPSWVFGVAWTLIYTLIGIALAASRGQAHHRRIWLLILCLNGWWLAFAPKCRPRKAFASILIILVYSVWVMTSSGREVIWTLAPLVAWLTYASVLALDQAYQSCMQRST